MKTFYVSKVASPPAFFIVTLDRLPGKAEVPHLAMGRLVIPRRTQPYISRPRGLLLLLLLLFLLLLSLLLLSSSSLLLLLVLFHIK